MLKIGYIALTAIMTLIVFYIGNYAINKSYEKPEEKKKRKLLMVIGLLSFLAYETILGNSGLLEDLSAPPKFALTLILPCFVFTGIFLYKQKDKAWITQIPSHWLIHIQVFRVLVETLFVYSVAQEILPKEVTIEGYNFDMAFAFTAPLIGYLLLKYKTKQLAIYWNYLGLLVLASVIFVFMTSLFKPELYGSSTALLLPVATHIPYLYVAGYLMPLAVFLHVLSLINLKKSKVINKA